MRHKIGLHVGGGEQIPQSMKLAADKGFDAVQFFLTNPQQSTIPNKFVREAVKNKPDIDIIIHAPFWFSVLGKNRKYCMRYLNLLSDIGDISFVVHIGSQVPNNAVVRIFLEEAAFHLHPKIKLLIENTAGSKTHGSFKIEDMVKVVKPFSFAGVCLDTEHAYAAGESLEDLDLNDFDLIHLNGIPSYVKFGGHLDRHSWTLLEKSKTEIFHVLEKLKTCNPTTLIFERWDRDISLADRSFLEEYLK